MERKVQLGMWIDTKQNEEGVSRVGQPDKEWKIWTRVQKTYGGMPLHREAAWTGKSDSPEEGGIQGLKVAQFGESEIKQGKGRQADLKWQSQGKEGVSTQGSLSS